MALFGRRNNSDTPPAPVEPKPEPVVTAPDPLPELDFLKEPPKEAVPELDFLNAPAAPAASSAAFETPSSDNSSIPGLARQNQYNKLILETEKPPVITVCRYGSNYVATDHIRNLQAVEHTEYEALEALIKLYKK